MISREIALIFSTVYFLMAMAFDFGDFVKGGASTLLAASIFVCLSDWRFRR